MSNSERLFRVARSDALGCLLLVLLSQLGTAQVANAGSLQQQIRDFREAHDVAILNEFRDLLAIPNNAHDSVNIRRNAELIVGMLSAHGVSSVQLLEAPGSPPVVYGELR